MGNPNQLPALTQWGERAIDLAISNVTAGGLPFSAVIINQQGQVIGEGVNQVAAQLDCTAHAEIQAIRNASQHEKSVLLQGATLIASGEPCALCYMAILLAKISRLVILADRHEAKAHGFDYLWTYDHLNSNSLGQLRVVKLDTDRNTLPFKLCQVRMEDTGL
ncbi:nucleoside deaminase [Rheinheimera hassiensis]|uniref:nucleoside deaminase n=1 Tax=Rheinheimera hassiensis TaxID=1193627 RepID=UPI001F05DEB5|nr:nucleoside deaminase [Rheinheimera hassiensis]